MCENVVVFCADVRQGCCLEIVASVAKIRQSSGGDGANGEKKGCFCLILYPFIRLISLLSWREIFSFLGRDFYSPRA